MTAEYIVPATAMVPEIPNSLVRFRRIADGAATGLAAASGVACLASAAATFADVVLRHFFNIYLIGVIEAQSLGIAVVAFATLAYTMSRDAHSRVELLHGLFSEFVRTLLDVVFAIWATILFALISWLMVNRGMTALIRREGTDNINFPNFPIYLIAALGCAVLVLVIVSRCAEAAHRLVTTYSNRLHWPLIGAFAVGVLPFVMAFLARDYIAGLDRASVGAFGIVIMVVVLLAGFPASFTMGLVGYLGLIYFFSNPTALKIIELKAYDSVEAYFMSVIPFFILMGFLIFKTGIGEKLYKAAQTWFGHFPGGLAIGTVFGCTGFAAMTGDSMSGTATMGTIALPEMERYNYDKSMAAGAIAAGGTLGILIPPSLGFVFYGIMTEQSIGKLLMAGLVPGLILSGLFALTIYVRCLINPALGPRAPKSSWSDRLAALWSVFPFVALAVLVIAGIYLALFTPTEAGAIGLVGAFVLSLATRKLGRSTLKTVVMQSMELVGMIMAILISVSIFGHFITAAGLPNRFAEIISGLEVSRWVIFGLILLLYMVLGMFMNIVPMIMLTMPVIFPTVTALGFDPIWFGVVIVIMMEMGTITPPVGINVFVLHGVAKHIPMSQMFIGIVPFVFCMLAMIILLAIFPQIALALPNSMDLLKPISMR